MGLSASLVPYSLSHLRLHLQNERAVDLFVQVDGLWSIADATSHRVTEAEEDERPLLQDRPHGLRSIPKFQSWLARTSASQSGRPVTRSMRASNASAPATSSAQPRMIPVKNGLMVPTVKLGPVLEGLTKWMYVWTVHELLRREIAQHPTVVGLVDSVDEIGLDFRILAFSLSLRVDEDGSRLSITGSEDAIPAELLAVFSAFFMRSVEDHPSKIETVLNSLLDIVALPTPVFRSFLELIRLTLVLLCVNLMCSQETGYVGGCAVVHHSASWRARVYQGLGRSCSHSRSGAAQHLFSGRMLAQPRLLTRFAVDGVEARAVVSRALVVQHA